MCAKPIATMELADDHDEIKVPPVSPAVYTVVLPNRRNKPGQVRTFFFFLLKHLKGFFFKNLLFSLFIIISPLLMQSVHTEIL